MVVAHAHDQLADAGSIPIGAGRGISARMSSI
jgi:hypothetical protein